MSSVETNEAKSGSCGDTIRNHPKSPIINLIWFERELNGKKIISRAFDSHSVSPNARVNETEIKTFH